MDGHCTKCEAALSSSCKFCPMCGATSMQAPLAPVELDEERRAPTEGAYAGLLFGLLAVPLLLIVGTMLCLTGLGAILGIPMILAAILAPIMAPLFGMMSHKGKCPSCGASLSNMENGHKSTCPVCNHSFAVKHGLFTKAA